MDYIQDDYLYAYERNAKRGEYGNPGSEIMLELIKDIKDMKEELKYVVDVDDDYLFCSISNCPFRDNF